MTEVHVRCARFQSDDCENHASYSFVKWHESGYATLRENTLKIVVDRLRSAAYSSLVNETSKPESKNQMTQTQVKNLIEIGLEPTEIGTRQYIVILDANGNQLTKPMSWQNAVDWAKSPIVKEAFPGGVTVVPDLGPGRANESKIRDLRYVARMVEAYCPTGKLNHGEDYTITLNGLQIESIRRAAGPRECAPTYTARAAFGGQS